MSKVIKSSRSCLHSQPMEVWWEGLYLHQSTDLFRLFQMSKLDSGQGGLLFATAVSSHIREPTPNTWAGWNSWNETPWWWLDSAPHRKSNGMLRMELGRNCKATCLLHSSIVLHSFLLSQDWGHPVSTVSWLSRKRLPALCQMFEQKSHATFWIHTIVILRIPQRPAADTFDFRRKLWAEMVKILRAFPSYVLSLPREKTTGSHWSGRVSVFHSFLHGYQLFFHTTVEAVDSKG